MDGCCIGPFPRAPLCHFMRDIQYVYVFTDVYFSPDHSRYFSVSRCPSLYRIIHIKKWIKAPNFLAYGRKWYAAYRIGIGKRAISTGPRNAYFVKSYEKLQEKWRNVVISVWIGRDHNYHTLFLEFYLLMLFLLKHTTLRSLSLSPSFSSLSPHFYLILTFSHSFFSLYAIRHIRVFFHFFLTYSPY